MISIKQKGDFKRTSKYLRKISEFDIRRILEPYGRLGVEALSKATPVDTGKTANSWNYEIVGDSNTTSIVWTNSNVNKGQNIAILLQYGHGTRNGGYVKGRDYINPTLQPIFDEIASAAWKEVIRS